jgi:hypothetical protein
MEGSLGIAVPVFVATRGQQLDSWQSMGPVNEEQNSWQEAPCRPPAVAPFLGLGFPSDSRTGVLGLGPQQWSLPLVQVSSQSQA